MKKLKDRKDGKRIKVNGMNYIMYHLKKKRCDSEVYINKKIDVTNLVKYMDKQKQESKNHLTYFHAFSAGIAKVIYNRPYLNRFIVNGHFYERNGVYISYVAKTEFNDDSQEVMQVYKVKPNDNILTISENLSKKVKSARKSTTSGTDNLVEKVGNMPKPLRAIIAGVYKFLDKHDLLPESMTKEILYYSTVILSNIGSIGSKEAIYHNITDFGTNSIIITMGKIYKEEIINENGKKEIKDFCEFGITLDERIADGFYMIKSIELLENIFKNPKLLEDDCSEKLEIK